MWYNENIPIMKLTKGEHFNNATQLQIAANKKFSWNADKTTKVMQDLYEHKLMTYPRTNANNLSDIGIYPA